MTKTVSPAVSQLVPDGLTPNRDSQQERKSSEMRNVVLDATVECLATRGYAQTTNNLICELANISRGAMLHHYPTRQELMVAVIDYAFYRHMSAFSTAIRALTDQDRMDRNVGIAIDWQLCQSREYQAYIELNVAARTNPELRAIFVPRARRHDEVWRAELLEVFPEWRRDPKKLDLMRHLTRAILEGMVLRREIHKDLSTEWAVLGLVAEISHQVRTDRLRFPEPDSLGTFRRRVASLRPRSAAQASRPRRTKTTDA